MVSIKKTLQQYKGLHSRLTARLDELGNKKQRIKARQSVMVSHDNSFEYEGVVMRDMASQTEQVTDILVEIIQAKIGFINETIESLQALMKLHPRPSTPMELQLSRFEDWVDTNQQLFELNARLYETQKNMFDMRDTQTDHGSSTNRLNSQEQSVIQNSVDTANILLNFERAPTGFSAYISERLHPRNNRMTFEATKIEEYIHECSVYHGGTLENPPVDDQGVVRGAHPRAYHKFVEVLCNYITERHRSSQGQELQAAEVYTAIEHQIVPRVKGHIMTYVVEHDKDTRLHQSCVTLEGVTLSQLRVPPEYRTNELAPFADAISYLKGSVFSESPTDKMYSIVKAAKSLHDVLGMIQGGGIDGDTFLDLWIYVTIKANIKDMATNVKLMTEYGNPQLSMGEAGYYLTTITAAMNYIETLTPDMLGPQVENETLFLTCEKERARSLCRMIGSCFELVKEDVELSGYQIAVVHKWAMDSSKLFRTILLPTGDDSGQVSVSIIRLSNAHASPESVQFFYNRLTEPLLPWITCGNIMNSMARIASPNTAIKEQLIFLPDGCVEDSLDALTYSMQLVRLSSETRHVFETKEESMGNRSGLSRHYSTQRSPSHTHDLNEPHDPYNFGQHRSRFSLPVKRPSKKAGKASIQTERLLGNRENSFDYSSKSPSPENPSLGIVVSAEVYSAPVSLVHDSSMDDIIEKDNPNHRQNSPDVDMTPDYFSSEYIRMLEMNFVHNHLNGVTTDSLMSSVRDTVQQYQLILQRLNYLSTIHKLDGVYDDMTLHAVQLYQVTQNKRKTVSSARISSDGILNVSTCQALIKDYTTRLNNLIKASKDLSMGLIDIEGLMELPLSIQSDDLTKFTTIVSRFQQSAGITDTCRDGVLCNETSACVQKLLRRRSTFS